MVRYCIRVHVMSWDLVFIPHPPFPCVWCMYAWKNELQKYIYKF